MSHQEHEQRAQAEQRGPIRCAILTASDSRTPETDTSGATLRTRVSEAGHTVVRYELVRDEPSQIVDLINAFVAEGCQVVITNGGTGIGRRDSTVDAIEALFEKTLPGFGELFRMLSYQEIGAAAMLSRATAGVYQGTIIFCLPGSNAAVRLALDTLIMPQIEHLVWEIFRS
ncbi:MAG: MogA/MoaB family molybdenum cofactor biosynthesis protein [Oscillochloridaceae bacterium umkhey_bin13]